MILMRPALSENSPETNRLLALNATNLLDSPAELRFDRITRMAQNALGTKVALISFIDEKRQWFKSTAGTEVTETPRDVAFCNHAIRAPDDVMVVLDAAKDLRFSENPLVTGDPNISFYAGAPLVTEDGHALGTLCVIDSEPRVEFSDDDRQLLSDLAESAMSEINLAQAQQENADLNLINEELQHRMGNMYAHISGLISMLGRSDASRDQLLRRLRSKITVLAHTQTLLAKHSYSRVSLRELAETTLAPFGLKKTDETGRISIQMDEDTEVSARAAFTLTLMLNELATNAMKHGALAADAGKVDFSWTLLPTPKLSWRETLSEPIIINDPEVGTGFGMQILSRIVPLDFQGEAEFDILPTGLNYQVTALRDRLVGAPTEL
mgnify:CR=1 FL=1